MAATTLSAKLVNQQPGSSTSDESGDQVRKTAEQFESLLVHNMLKSMRRTTLSEGSSNEKALYDDMLDKHLASEISKSGRLGIADAIERQLTPEKTATSTSSIELQKLHNATAITSDKSNAKQEVDATKKTKQSQIPGLTAIDLYRFRMAAGLLVDGDESSLSIPKQNFINPLLPHADRNARRLGTSPNAILAVAALESGWGEHMITDAEGIKSHNLFGIKSTSKDSESVESLTTEFFDGKPVRISDRFKVFESPADAVDGFADFILENPRYQEALEHASDPKRFLIELQRAGYATDPQYANKAIEVLQQIEHGRGVQ